MESPSPGAASPGAESTASTAGEYYCPMHPTVRQQGEGFCPKCGMNLVPAAAGQAHASMGQGMRTNSARAAWVVAGIAVLLLIGVWLLGPLSQGGFVLSSGGLVLLVLLACPLTMGAMMWMMGRRHH